MVATQQGRSQRKSASGNWQVKRRKGAGDQAVVPRSTFKGAVKNAFTVKCSNDWKPSLVFYKVTGSERNDHRAVIEAVREGLSTDVVEVLIQALDVTRTEFFDISGIPKSTLSRRLKTGTLTPEESDRLVRLARIKDLALEMMEGDDAAAKEWLNTPSELLGGETPIHYSNTEIGARDVESLIGRIRMGVFS